MFSISAFFYIQYRAVVRVCTHSEVIGVFRPRLGLNSRFCRFVPRATGEHSCRYVTSYCWRDLARVRSKYVCA